MLLTAAERDIFKVRLQVYKLSNAWYNNANMRDLIGQDAQEMADYITRILIKRGFLSRPTFANLIPKVLEHIEDYLNKDVITKIIKHLRSSGLNAPDREYIGVYLEAALQRS